MPPSSSVDGDEVLAFGTFELARSRKALLENGRTVRLGSRALDLLLALVDRAGAVVSKSELIAIAWPSSYVEESNLRVHVAALRKILGDGRDGARYIVNVSGRGYCFVAPVTRRTVAQPPTSIEPTSRQSIRLPLTRIVGRTEEIDSLTARLKQRRLVTIAGPAGVGKTTLSLVVAERSAGSFTHQACCVELSPVTDPALVPLALAAVLGIAVQSEDPTASVVAYLADTNMLILIDNCEHVIAAATHMVERILKAAPRVHILATSREPLLAEGEYVYRLSPLALPPHDEGLTSDVAATYSAVQLFVERAVNSLDLFTLSDDNVRDVISICRRLDGMPLAIELVAARVDLFGVAGLASILDDRFMLVAKGRRTAQPRHQSLRAALDWSFSLLSPGEQSTLSRLAVFRGSFRLESAVAVTADADDTPPDLVLERIASLVSKSLVTADVGGAVPFYRLSHAMRAYATERLGERGALQATARRHAMHVLAFLEGAKASWDFMSRAQWIESYGYAIDDVRAALDWAFGPGGDPAVRGSLTVAALPFGFQLSQIDEFKRRCALALEGLGDPDPANALTRLRLTVALGVLEQNTSNDEQRSERILRSALDLAEQASEARHMIEPITASAIFAIDRGRYGLARELTDRLGHIAQESNDPLAVLSADRVGAQARHFAGDQRRARVLAERVIGHPARSIPLTYSQTSVDRQVSMRIVLARILWLEGRVDRAREACAECLERAHADGPFAVVHTLALAACPIAFWRGDLEDAARHTSSLVEYTRRYTVERWGTLAQCYRELLASAGSAPVPDFERDPALPVGRLQRDLVATIRDWGSDGELPGRAEAEQGGWCQPELLRLAAERLPSAQGAVSHAVKRKLLDRAVQSARDQGALSWELRASISILRMESQSDGHAAASAQLRAVLERFTEGAGTVDQTNARGLLQSTR